MELPRSREHGLPAADRAVCHARGAGGTGTPETELRGMTENSDDG